MGHQIFMCSSHYSHQSLVGEQHTGKPTGTTLLFTIFNMTHLITQESGILSNCCIFDDMLFWPTTIKVFQEMACFNLRRHFRIHNKDT